ncbi:MAG: serine/threonine-protein phosphatase, partial [Hyphomicrobiales bacterium]
TDNHPETEGMGATLVVPALVENRLWWISIGDSPLFLFRNGKLSQLNEDHSMAPQIDFMVQAGLLDPEIAINHPDRNCLVSVLMGSKIAKVDCPAKPYLLQAGDIVVCSSDGLQFMSNATIEKVLTKYRKTRSTEIAERLLEELNRLADPDQDNISFTVIKVNNASVRPRQSRPARQPAVARPRGLTMVVPEPLILPLPGIASELPGTWQTEPPVPDPAVVETPKGPSLVETGAEDTPERGTVVPRRFAALG